MQCSLEPCHKNACVECVSRVQQLVFVLLQRYKLAGEALYTDGKSWAMYRHMKAHFHSHTLFSPLCWWTASAIDRSVTDNRPTNGCSHSHSLCMRIFSNIWWHTSLQWPRPAVPSITCIDEYFWRFSIVHGPLRLCCRPT